MPKHLRQGSLDEFPSAVFNLGLELILDGLESLLEVDLSTKRIERAAEPLE